jgi:Domain of unknown function (DUF4157)
MTTKSQTTVTPAAQPLLNADKSGLLQRKCECGNTAGLTGECSDCQGNRFTKQPGSAAQNGAAPVLHDLIQPKLTVGAPNDKYEQEADRVAEQVVQVSDSQSSIESPGQRSNLPFNIQKLNRSQIEPLYRQEIDETKKKKKEEDTTTKTVQTKEQQGQTPEVATGLEARLRGREGKGQPLPKETRSFMESQFGHDFSQVRVHSDSQAADMNRELNAQAFTYRHDVFFGTGGYNPDSVTGKRLLAHELTHVVQQTGAEAQVADGSVVQAKGKFGSATPQTAMPKTNSPVATDVGVGATPKSDVPAPKVPADKKAAAKKPVKESKKPSEKLPAPSNTASSVSNVTTESAEAKGKTSGDGLLMPEPPQTLSKGDRNRIAQVQENATEAAKVQSTLPDASSNVAEARGSVTEPPEETQARAGGEVVAEFLQKEPPSPEIEELCEKIRKAIHAKRPPNEDELVKTDPTSVAKQAGSQLDSSIKDNTKQVQNNYDELQKPPQGEPQQQPQEIVAPPQSVDTPLPGAQAAVPNAVPAKDVSLEADVAAGEQRIQDAGMNSEAAKLVQTGPISEARAAQGELVATAERDPIEVMAEQQAALDKAGSDMLALQQSAMMSLAEGRATTIDGVTNKQQGMVESEEKTRIRVGNEAKTIFETAQKKVNEQIQPLSDAGMKKWDAGIEIASRKFKQRLKEVESWIEERHSGTGGSILGVWDDLTGLPGWVEEKYTVAEVEFGDDVCILIREISSDINTVIAISEKIIDDARKQIDKLFAELPDGLKLWAEGEKANFTAQLDGLHDQVTKTRDDFNKNLVDKAANSVQEARSQIYALREKAKGLIGRLSDAINAFLDDPIRAIINGLLQLVNISPASFWALIAKIEQVIADIVDDPIKFANNLMAAIGQGFKQFFDNIKEHLLEGLLAWLLSGLTSVGVNIPQDLSLKSVITFFLELMGITWARIRKLLAKRVGEKNVALLEKAFSVVADLITLGPEGIFELLKDKLDPDAIMKQVMDAAVSALVDALITQVTARILLLFNPVGAIAQAVEAVYRVLSWVFHNAARIFSLIETVVNGIANVIAGNIDGMANAVEMALTQLIAPVIDFLADYMSLGGLPDKIANVIQGFQGWVEGILDTVIGWLAEQGKKLFRIGGEEGQEKKDGRYDGQIGKEVKFTAGKESHRLWIVQNASDVVVMMASEEKSVAEQLNNFKSIINKPEFAEEKKEEVIKLISQAESVLSELSIKAKQLSVDSNKSDTLQEKIVEEDNVVEGVEDSLSSSLKLIMEKIYVEIGLKERFKSEFAKMDVLASEYSLKKLKEDKTIQKAGSWQEIRSWLLTNGLIFTQPLTTTTNFAKERTDPKAELAAQDAIKEVNSKKDASTIVEKNRSDVNAGIQPFDTAKSILQEYAFSENISPFLTLKKAYVAKLNEVPPDIAEMLNQLRAMQGVSGIESLTGTIESIKVKPQYKWGAIFQVERALAYYQQGLLKAIEFEFVNENTGEISRFDLVIKDPSNKVTDDGSSVEVIVEVKNWTGFSSLDPITQVERLGNFIAQLEKYQATGKRVIVDWKGEVPLMIMEAVQKRGIKINGGL